MHRSVIGVRLGGSHEAGARVSPLANDSVDLVVTSTPYPNSIDYVRCSKVSLVWTGHSIADFRQTRAESIGTEVGTRELAEGEA